MSSAAADVVLGIDLDGVCADFYCRMREIAAEWFERPIETLPPEVTYSLREWGIRDAEHYVQLHRFAVTQRDLFETCRPIPGAAAALRQLSDEGYRIRIITHRLIINFFHEQAVSQTVRWLDHHGIPYRDLCFMGDKDQVGADLYVDDAPHNIAALRAAGLEAICFGNSTNRDVAAPRAENWEQVLEMIHARHPAPGR